MTLDEKFMREAIALSRSAAKKGNEPFGAVLVKGGEIVYKSENEIYTKCDPTWHAEAGLLRRFVAESGITDLSDYTLYSSCEPCFMCSGALVWVKIGRLVYGASDKDLCALLGVTGSECAHTVFGEMGHKAPIEAGVRREEALTVLREYFKDHKKG